MMVFKLDTLNDRYIGQIADLEKECFSCPNSKELIAGDIANKNVAIFVAIDDEDSVCGYVGLHFVLDEGYMDNLGVIKSCRRQGVASSLLNALDDFAKEKRLSFITLEVRQSNSPAIQLYEKHGYEKVGKRINFYRCPNEDALLMTKNYT